MYPGFSRSGSAKADILFAFILQLKLEAIYKN